MKPLYIPLIATVLVICNGCATSGDISGGLVDQTSSTQPGPQQFKKDINECRVESGLPPLIPQVNNEPFLIDLALAALLVGTFKSPSFDFIDGLKLGGYGALEAAGIVGLVAAGAAAAESQVKDMNESSAEDLSNASKSKLQHCLAGRGYQPKDEDDLPLMLTYLKYLAACNTASIEDRLGEVLIGEEVGRCGSGRYVAREFIADSAIYEQDFANCLEYAKNTEVSVENKLVWWREERFIQSARDHALFSCLADRGYRVLQAKGVKHCEQNIGEKGYIKCTP